MGLILSLLLIVLGLLAAETVIAEKSPPAFRDWLVKLRNFQEQIGIAGLVLGTLSFIEWLTKLPYINLAPARLLLWLIAVLLTLALGLIFGLEPVRRNIKDTGLKFFATADAIRAKLLPYQTTTGLAGIVVGVLYLVVCI